MFGLTRLVKSVYRLQQFGLCRMSKIAPPKNPTMAESFGVKLTTDEMQVLLDPRGFLSEEEREIAEAGIPVNEASPRSDPKEPMEPEYGFKYNGPEPTRFGDWSLKGKCVDF